MTSPHSVNHYYPYGVPFPTMDDFTPMADRRLYGDKELLTFMGYNTYDYSARHYYAAASCFDNPDPKAHDYTWLSPYTFCAGNPVMYVDEDGRELKFANMVGGDIEYLTDQMNKAGQNYEYSINEKGMVTIKTVGTTRTSSTRFNNLVSRAIDSQETVTINIEHGTMTRIGSFEKESIDIDDIKALGNDYVVNETSAFVHEVSEQCLKKMDNLSEKPAHVEATIIEGQFSGVQFEPEREPEKIPGLPVEYTPEDNFMVIYKIPGTDEV